MPGVRADRPTGPGWGLGQIPSMIGDRVTVNFEHAGKVLINSDVIDLVPLDDENAAA
ncbi:MAG TPA: DUF3553 domain-containing protein [Alphaproteobacteria bacterium]|jgi:hypothetical protein|nr:DUF3553 domain-containing protein [Alphaproteobacteria bacterium]